MEMRTSKRRLPSSVSTEEKPSLRPPGPANRSMTGIVLSRVINCFLFVNRLVAWTGRHFWPLKNGYKAQNIASIISPLGRQFRTLQRPLVTDSDLFPDDAAGHLAAQAIV